MEIRENPIFCDLLLEVGSDPLAKNTQSNTLVGSPRYLWSLGQCAACNNKIEMGKKWKNAKMQVFHYLALEVRSDPQRAEPQVTSLGVG